MGLSHSPTLNPDVQEVATGVYRFGTNRVNWYIIEEDGRLTIVDAGFPTHWQRLFSGLITLEYGVEDIGALILTHAHPDHIGFAERLRTEADVPVWLHEAGIQRAQAGGDPPVVETVKHLWRPAVLGYFIEALRSNGTSVPPLTTVEPFTDGEDLAVPGQPHAIHVPGHTEDEVVFSLPDRNVVFCGDALATVEFETWRGNTPTSCQNGLTSTPTKHENPSRSLTRWARFISCQATATHGGGR